MSDLLKPVVIDLEDERMRTEDDHSALQQGDIRGVDFPHGDLGAGVDTDLPSSGARVPDPATHVKPEIHEEEADTVHAHFATPLAAAPVIPPPKQRHFEMGTPPDKKPKFPAPGLACFGNPLAAPLFAGPTVMTVKHLMAVNNSSNCKRYVPWLACPLCPSWQNSLLALRRD